MAELFIISRAGDADHMTGHIINYLTQTFGTDDVTGTHIPVTVGADVRAEYEQRLSRGHAVAVLIGRRFFETNALTNPVDAVRLALTSALRRQTVVIPVLIDGAILPDPRQLPTGLDALAYRSPMSVRDVPDFQRDMEELTGAIRQAVMAGRTTAAPRQPTPPPAVAAVPQSYHQPAPTPQKSSGGGAASTAFKVATAPVRGAGRGCGWMLTYIFAPLLATLIGRIFATIFGLASTALSAMFAFAMIQSGGDFNAAFDIVFTQLGDIIAQIRQFIEQTF